MGDLTALAGAVRTTMVGMKVDTTTTNGGTIRREELHHPDRLRALRTVALLLGAFLATSACTLVTIVLLRHHTTLVTAAVWIRGGFALGSAVVSYALAVRATAGSRAAYRRLRIVSAVMLMAIVTIVSLPGTFPLWLKIEQGFCGLLLLGVVVIVNGRQLRTLFAAR